MLLRFQRFLCTPSLRNIFINIAVSRSNIFFFALSPPACLSFYSSGALREKHPRLSVCVSLYIRVPSKENLCRLNETHTHTYSTQYVALSVRSWRRKRENWNLKNMPTLKIKCDGSFLSKHPTVSSTVIFFFRRAIFNRLTGEEWRTWPVTFLLCTHVVWLVKIRNV